MTKCPTIMFAVQGILARVLERMTTSLMSLKYPNLSLIDSFSELRSCFFLYTLSIFSLLLLLEYVSLFSFNGIFNPIISKLTVDTLIPVLLFYYLPVMA